MRNRSMPTTHSRLGAILAGCVAIMTSVFVSPHSVNAQEPREPRPSFRAIVHRHTAAMLDDVLKYVQSSSDQADRRNAYRWLFETAAKEHWEDRVLEAADDWLAGDPDDADRANALKVRAVGLVRTGKGEAALADFQSYLRLVRLTAPNETLELAQRLAGWAQCQGDVALARTFYERTSSALLLNPYARQACQTRIAKLELVGGPAPEVTVKDLEGKRVNLSDDKGRVVVLDYWATNCAPCVEEFPTWKQWYAELHPRGLEMVGVSLDESQADIETFQDSFSLPWRLAMSSTDSDATREAYHVETIPSVFVIDRKGMVFAADLRGELLRIALEKLVRDPE